MKRNILSVQNRRSFLVREHRQQAQTAYARVLRKVNQRPNSACVQRVLRMIQLMKEAECLRLKMHKRGMDLLRDPVASKKYVEEVFKLLVGVKGADGKAHPPRSFSDPELQALNVEFIDRRRKIRKGLKRYRWTPTVQGHSIIQLNQGFVWPGIRRDSDEFWENLAMSWLLGEISGLGQSPAPILRFRQCRQCSKSFYASTKPQVHCSASCRLKSYRDSPEFRAKAAKYMREEYRPREKELDERAKRKVKKGRK